MPKRPDEVALWEAFGPEGSGAEFRWVRDAMEALGIDPKRAYYLCCKWADKGLYEWGTWWYMGWKVEA